VHGDFETLVNEMPPSIVCVAPCHPPVASRSDAVHVKSWEVDVGAVPSAGRLADVVGTFEVDVEAVVPAGSLAGEEQEAKTSPAMIHETMTERRSII
jgi:hypothetical protein